MLKLFEGLNRDLSVKSQWICLLLFTVILFSFYGDVLNNGYSLDDAYAYTSNKNALDGLNSFKAIFTQNSFDYGAFQFGYRPIAVLSFAIENELFGVNATASHFINLLLYLFSSFILFKVLVRLFPDKLVSLSFLTTVLFIILPIHSEIANNVKCRDELLMLFWGLSALYLFLKKEKGPIEWILIIVLLLLSILSKKSGFIFLGVLPTTAFFMQEGGWKEVLKTFLLMTLPVLLFKLTTKFLKGERGGREFNFTENPLFSDDVTVNKTVIVLESIWFYVQGLLLPTQFVSYYGYDTIPVHEFGLGAVFAIVSIVLLITIALIGIKKREAYGLGMLIMIGGIIPFMNLLQPMVGIVAERFITMSSIGYCILVIFGIDALLKHLKKEKWQKVVGFLLLGYTIAYLPVIKERNAEWDSQLSVLEADVLKEPKSAVLSSALANNYYFEIPKLKTQQAKLKMGKRAIELCDQSIATYPTKSTYNYKGSILFNVFGKAKEAEENYLKSMKVDSTYLNPLSNLGIMHQRLKQPDQSIYYFKLLIEKDGKQLTAYEPLAQQLCGLGKFNEALEVMNYGLKENPNEVSLYINNGNIYYQMKDYKNSLLWFEKSLAIDPTNRAVQARVRNLRTQLKKAV